MSAEIELASKFLTSDNCLESDQTSVQNNNNNINNNEKNNASKFTT